MKYDSILIRYGELALKSNYVRSQFELKLVRNIKKAFNLYNLKCEPSRERGRIYIKTDEINKGLVVLRKVFGITSFSPVVKTTSDINHMISLAKNLSKEIIDKEKSFALRVTRSGNHDFTSQDVAVKIGNEIVEATKAGVDLTHPDFKLFIEIRNENAYFFTEKISGAGGLPLGTQGKILAIIDDPKSILAAWYLMRRGCSIIFLKTNNQITDPLHSFIKNWYVEPEIIDCILNEKDLYVTINKIASERSCYAIVTGHSIYDNSEETLYDIKKIKQQISFPVLNPLISMDLDEINKKNNEVGIIA